MKFLAKLSFISASLAATGFIMPASAQDLSSQIALNEMLGANFENQAGINRDDTMPQPEKLTPQKQAANLSSLTYQISMKRRQLNYESFIQKTNAKSAIAGSEIRAALSKGDLIEMARPNLERLYGLRVDNVADAYTLWMASAWAVVSGREESITRTELQSIRKQVISSFLNTPGMINATDEVKQNMAESLWISGFVVNEAGMQVKNDPTAKKKLAASVAANAKREMNVDLSAITLTDQGFVPRKGGKRSDAGDANDAADPAAQSAQMASATDSSGAGLGGADIAMLVAAVSAGAGGLFMIGKGISNQRQG
jgi:hypothetical protein